MMSMTLQKFDFLFPIEGIKRTVRRFPLASICAGAVFLIALLSIHDVIDDDEIFGRMSVIAICGYFWFGASKLFFEAQEVGGKGASEIVKFGTRMIGFAGLGFLIALSPQWGLHLIFLIPALLLLIMVAPYIRGGDDLSFWFYNRLTWFGVAVAILAALLWGGGLSAAIASIQYLFEIDVSEQAYGDIWAFSCLILGPLYALSWVPEKFSFTKEECNDPPGLGFLVNWVLAPLVVIYMLILYAYLARILIIQELPRGQLAYMITGFGGVGVATYLMGWPLREEGGVLLRLVYKAFFPALIIPVIMQFVAIWERIGQYGVTEQRYLVAMTVLWFAVIAVGYTIKKFPLKFIPLSLCALFVIGAFGPWGGVNISGISQMNRLEGLLSQYTILVDGKIIKTEDDIPFEDRQNISSILSYLNQTDRQEWLRPWVGKEGATDAYKLTEVMGFDYVSHYERPQKDKEYFYFNAPNPYNSVLDVRGFDFSVNANIYNNKNGWSQEWAADSETGNPNIKAEFKEGVLSLSVGESSAVEFDMQSYVEETLLEREEAARTGKMILQKREGGQKIRAEFMNINGQNKEDGIKITNMNVRFYVGTE